MVALPWLVSFQCLLIDDLLLCLGQEVTQESCSFVSVFCPAFVGYWVQSNWVFPWPNTLAGDSFPSADLSPEQQWDALPGPARWQIIAIIGLLELWDECGGGDPNHKHYMSGGKPGDYPSFQNFRDEVHWVLDLYDPFGFTKKMTQEKKDRRLLIEVSYSPCVYCIADSESRMISNVATSHPFDFRFQVNNGRLAVSESKSIVLFLHQCCF